MGTMMLVPYPSQYGVVESNDQGIVTQFIEKDSLPFWINAGVYLFDRKIESLLPDIGDHETTTFQDLAKQGKLSAFQSTMAWTTIDSPKDLSDVTDKIREGRLVLAGT
jgi:NDP-sugar pyrophosphorylase family protein